MGAPPGTWGVGTPLPGDEPENDPSDDNSTRSAARTHATEGGSYPYHYGRGGQGVAAQKNPEGVEGGAAC